MRLDTGGDGARFFGGLLCALTFHLGAHLGFANGALLCFVGGTLAGNLAIERSDSLAEHVAGSLDDADPVVLGDVKALAQIDDRALRDRVRFFDLLLGCLEALVDVVGKVGVGHVDAGRHRCDDVHRAGLQLQRERFDDAGDFVVEDNDCGFRHCAPPDVRCLNTLHVARSNV